MSYDSQSLGQVCRVHAVDLTRPRKIALVDPEYRDPLPSDEIAKELCLLISTKK